MGRSSTVGALVAALVVACGGDKGGPSDGSGGPPSIGWTEELPTWSGAVLPEPTGGTRLKVLRHRTIDGASVFAGWYDEQLGSPCSFRSMPDGTLRCIPNDAAQATVFLDAACTVHALIRSSSACGATPRVGEVRGDTCPTTTSLFRLSSEEPAVAYFSEAYVKGTRSCTLRTARTGDRLYRLGEPVPLETLVAATLEPGPAAGGIVPVFRQAEDGSRSFFSFRDQRTGASCGYGRTSDGKGRCLPFGGQVSRGLFIDAACTQPAAVANGTCPGPLDPLFLRYTLPDTCPRTATVVTAGPKQTAYDATFGACEPVANRLQIYYTPGTDLPPTDFAEASVAVLPGIGRLRPLVQVTPAGAAPQNAFWDSKVKGRCRPEIAADGATRCLPEAVATELDFRDYYDNPGCTGQRYRIIQPYDCAIGFVRSEIQNMCVTRVRIFPIGPAAHVGPLYVYSSGCLPSGLQPPSSGYALGAELPATDFVEVAVPSQ